MGIAPVETPAPEPEPSAPDAPLSACGILMDENGAEHIQYCDYHQEIADMAASLLARAGETNALRAQKQIRAMWQTELEGLYGEWLQGVPAQEQGAIIAAQATFMNYLSVQETALERRYGDKTSFRQINAALERQCATLCNMLRGEQ